MAKNEALQAVEAVGEKIAELRTEAKELNRKQAVATTLQNLKTKLRVVEKKVTQETLNEARYAALQLSPMLQDKDGKALREAAREIVNALEPVKDALQETSPHAALLAKMTEQLKALASRCLDALERAELESR